MGGMLDELEEGYEITIEVDHAERDPHLVQHITRALTDKQLDVTSFDMAEEDKGSNAHTKLSLFVRRNVQKGEKQVVDKRTQKIIKATIKQYLKAYNLDVSMFKIVAVTASEAKMLCDEVNTKGNLQEINKDVLDKQRQMGTSTCLTPSPKKASRSVIPRLTLKWGQLT